MRSTKLVLSIFFVCVLFVGMGTASAMTDAEQRALLEQELARIEADIAAKRGVLEEKQRERTSLERDVAILDAKIDTAKLSIKQRDLAIQRLEGDIRQKQSGMQTLDQKVVEGQASIAQLLRITQTIDDTSIVELALREGRLSDIVADIDYFSMIEESLGESFERMAVARDDLSARKKALEEQRSEENELRHIQVLQRQSLESAEKEKQTLVNAAKGQEKEYQKVIADREKSAAEIRAALFDLRDTKSVSFGDMLAYAKEASVKTGVRPAVILGILAEESNLGENVGTGNWKTDMHPTRDQPVFEEICLELGLDPDSVPVSKKAWYGWGGAMGPAQFIPSTWILYKDRIAKVTGQEPPNPWNPRTAVFATAILMMDNGADKGTRAAERLAALRYLAGWKNATKPEYSFYGDDVMELAEKYQKQIDILGG